jgi:hypothetical protein
MPWFKSNSNMCWEEQNIQFSHVKIERCSYEKGSNMHSCLLKLSSQNDNLWILKFAPHKPNSHVLSSKEFYYIVIFILKILFHPCDKLEEHEFIHTIWYDDGSSFESSNFIHMCHLKPWWSISNLCTCVCLLLVGFELWAIGHAQRLGCFCLVLYKFKWVGHVLPFSCNKNKVSITKRFFILKENKTLPHRDWNLVGGFQLRLGF